MAAITLRLLIDVTADDRTVAELQRVILDQPAVSIGIEHPTTGLPWVGRLVGATEAPHR